MAHLNHSWKEDSAQQNYRQGKSQSSLECENNGNSCHGNEETLESSSDTAVRHQEEKVDICMVDEASTLNVKEFLNQEQQSENDLPNPGTETNTELSSFKKNDPRQSINNLPDVNYKLADETDNPERTLIVFLILTLFLLQKKVYDAVGMTKDEEKPDSSLVTKNEEKEMRFSDFSRTTSDCWRNSCINPKGNIKSVPSTETDGLYDFALMLKIQDVRHTYATRVKKLVISLQYRWINSWEKSLKYLLAFNPGAFFVATNQVVARVAVDSSKIPSVTDNDENNDSDDDDGDDDDDDGDDGGDFDSDDGFDINGDEGYDPDEEMNENEIEYLADVANNYNGIQNEDNGNEINGIEEHEYDEILFVLPNQELNDEYNQTSDIVCNQIIFDQENPDDLMENNQTDMENVEIIIDD